MTLTVEKNGQACREKYGWVHKLCWLFLVFLSGKFEIGPQFLFLVQKF